MTTLFRAKRNHNQKWVYGSLVIDKDGDIAIFEPSNVRRDGHHITQEDDKPMFFDKETLGQYIEFDDKNGDKIFTGDKVEVCRGDTIEQGVVYFDNRVGAYAVRYNNQEHMNLIFDLVTSMERDKRVYIKIIGNIHD